MENLDLEKFNPTRAEVVALVEKCKGIVITGVEDKEGYKKAHEARMELKNTRVSIQKTGKALRAGALAFQKAVIEKEKELVSLIGPTETELESKQNAIDEAKEKLKRANLLPERKQKLLGIDVSVDDDFLLGMDDAGFSQFFNGQKELYLTVKERKLQEERNRVEAEKNAILKQKEETEKEKQRQIELEQARKDTEIRVRKELEAKAEREKQAEQGRIEAEAKEKEKFEKQKKYQAFLKENGYTEQTKDNYIIQRNGTFVVIFKKIAEAEL